MEWIISNREWIFSGIGAMLIFSLATIIRRVVLKIRGNNRPICYPEIIDANEIDALKKLFLESTEIMIFASSAETFRGKLITVLRGLKIEQTKYVKVLVRDDGSENRNWKLQEEEAKWNHEIVRESNNMIKVAFKRYLQTDTSVFLRGYVFDKRHAMLGWYLNVTDRRLGSNYPLVLYSSSDLRQLKIIEFANDTFKELPTNKLYTFLVFLPKVCVTKNLACLQHAAVFAPCLSAKILRTV